MVSTCEAPGLAGCARGFRLRRFAVAVLLVGVSALSACGGGGNEQGAQDVLDTAFKKSVNSADLALDAQLKLNGASSGIGPVRVQAKGPYRSNKGKLPSVDLDLA